MKNSKGHLRRLIRTMKPYGGLAVLSLLTATATVAAQLMVPVITGDAIDCMVAEGRVDFAVLGILLTAPLGAFGMDRTYKRILQREGQTDILFTEEQIAQRESESI